MHQRRKQYPHAQFQSRPALNTLRARGNCSALQIENLTISERQKAPAAAAASENSSLHRGTPINRTCKVSIMDVSPERE